MFVLQKTFDNIGEVYEDLKKVFDYSDLIIASMTNYLTKDRNICHGINDIDIVLCQDNNQSLAQKKVNTITSITNGNTIKVDCNNSIDADYKDSTTGDPNFFELERSVNPYTNTADFNNITKISDIAINYVNQKYNFTSYIEFVKWAIYEIEMNPPSPFNLGYPVSCYCLTLRPESFVIKFPNNMAFGIEVAVTKDKIFYNASIIYYNPNFTDIILFKETNLYKAACKNNWIDSDSKGPDKLKAD